MADNVSLDNMSGGSVVATDNIGDVHYQIVKPAFGPDGAGTMVSQTNPMPVNVHNGGTVQGGTINIVAGGSIVTNGGYLDSLINGSIHVTAGTVRNNPKPTTNLSAIGSVWGTNSGTAGTLIAAVGAGTSIFINELSISNEGTSVLTAGIGYGTAQQGTTVLARVAMAGNGGIQKSFPIPVGGSHPNLPLVIWTTGSGTASFNVSYWTEAQ